MKTQVKISSGNTKLGNMHNISLTPIKGCVNCQACKKSCYALKAYKMYANTRKAWNGNLRLARKDRCEYFAQIYLYLMKHKPKFFRWHVAGDILDQAYLDAMIGVAIDTPQTKFLCFTKAHHLNFKDLPENLSIVLSMWPTMPIPAINLPKAWMQDGTETRMPRNAIECPGNCETCGMCFALKKLGRDVMFHKH
jgi:hypothetical protein